MKHMNIVEKMENMLFAARCRLKSDEAIHEMRNEALMEIYLQQNDMYDEDLEFDSGWNIDLAVATNELRRRKLIS